MLPVAAPQHTGNLFNRGWIGRIAMSISLRRIAVLAVLGLAGLSVGETYAQTRLRGPLTPAPQLPALGVMRPRGITYTPFARPTVLPWDAQSFTPQSVAASQAARNIATIGQGLSFVPPYALGYNPYPSPILSTGPLMASPGYASLSSGPGFNPYATSASLSTSPYGGYASMSTMPYGSSGAPYSNSGGYGYQDPYGAELQGVASLTAATGQYYQQLQNARITREQSRQMALDTQRKQIELEMWYESVRPTTPKLLRQQAKTNLDVARNLATPTQIWSGDALNELLRSAIKSGKLNRGPNLGLEEDTLRHINLTSKASRSNIGLLKNNGGELSWPLVLQEEAFEKPRTQLDLKLMDAVAHLKKKQAVPAATLRDANKLHKTLVDTLDASADDLTPGQYIEAKRYLNQVRQAIRALEDPKAANYFNNTWNAKGKNVAELVDHLNKEGLEFAPATPGDEAAYRALYNALRNFEAGMQAPATSKE